MNPAQLNLFGSLFQRIYTTSDLHHFYKQLDQIRGLLFKTDGDFEEHMGMIFNSEKKEKMKTLFNQEKTNISNPIPIQELLTKIEKYGSALPIISMTFSHPPTEHMLKNINNWFIEHENRKVLIDVSFERNLLGGAFVSYNGLYADGTLINKINEYFKNNI